MALNLEDPETDVLARQVARLTGETVAEAVRGALKDRLVRERARRGEPSWDRGTIESVIARFSALPLLDGRGDAEILGYGETGLPS